MQTHKRQSCVRSRNVTPSAAPKPLSTDLSAHQNKAAYQTPKYFQLTTKNYGSKCLTKQSKKKKKKFTHLGGGRPLAPPHVGPSAPAGKKKQFSMSKTALKSESAIA